MFGQTLAHCAKVVVSLATYWSCTDLIIRSSRLNRTYKRRVYIESSNEYSASRGRKRPQAATASSSSSFFGEPSEDDQSSLSHFPISLTHVRSRRRTLRPCDNVSYNIKIKGSSTESQKKANKGSRRERFESDDVIYQGTLLMKFNSLLALYKKFACLFFCYAAIKYALLCTLDLRILSSYRWLDCYVVGRFGITARTTDAAKYIGCAIATLHSTWRFVALVGKPKTQLDVVEFVLRNREQVLAEEMKAFNRYRADKLRDQQQRKQLQQQVLQQNEVGRDSLMNSLVANKRPVAKDGAANCQTYDSIFYIKDSMNLNRRENYIFRPNRTSKAWRTLVNFVLVYAISAAIFFTPIYLFVAYIGIPLTLTRAGFEVSYFNCVDWIKRQPSDVSASYSHIYKVQQEKNATSFTTPTLRRAKVAILPMSKLIPFNWYAKIKIGFDIFENFMFWTDSVFLYTGNLLILLLGAVDLSIYSSALRSMLKRLIVQLAVPSQRSWPIQSLPSTSDSFRAGERTGFVDGKSTLKSRETLDDERELILTTQKFIVDYFAFVSKYNPFSAAFALFWICCWICYSLVVCGYTFSVPNPREVIEYYYTELFLSSSIVVLLAMLCVVKSFSRRLYELIASAMAADGNTVQTKALWIVLLDYYFPVPMDCFTLFGTSRISWLFLLKLFSWMASAALVVSSFFKVYWVDDMMNFTTLATT